MSVESYCFSTEFQDAILACLIRFPGRFNRFGEIIKPEFFSGLQAVEVVFGIQDFYKKYGKYPDFSALGNFVYDRTERRNPDAAKELMDYVVKLANTSTADVDAIYDLSLKFAKERALLSALRKIAQSVHDGKRDKIDPLQTMEEALKTGDDDSQPRIEDCAQWLAKPIETPPELIQGVLHKGTKLVLGGASKSCKSWSLLDMAVSVACGVPWWGFKTIPSNVLFVNFEIHKPFFYKRLNDVVTAKKVNLEPGWMQSIHLRGHATDADKMLSRLEREIGRKPYDLIILDPIYKLLGGKDENKAGDIAEILNRIEALLVKVDAAVAFGAHYSKGNQAAKEAQDRIGGSGVFARDPDSLVNMTRHETDDAFTVDVTVRNFPPVDPFVVRWQWPVMVVDGDLNPARLRKPGFEGQYDPKDLALLLSGKPLTSGEWKTRALEELGMSEKTFYRLKKQLKNVTEEDKKFHLSEDTVT